jgi:hypothetical protein
VYIYILYNFYINYISPSENLVNLNFIKSKAVTDFGFATVSKEIAALNYLQMININIAKFILFVNFDYSFARPKNIEPAGDGGGGLGRMALEVTK